MGRIAFIEDYELHLAHRLVQGVDLWLNVPRVPLEACGTSGMKAALNGVPMLSTLDGWWAEGYSGTNGWAIPLADSGEDADEADIEQLFEIIENEVVPRFYDRDARGIPGQWVAPSGLRASASRRGACWRSTCATTTSRRRPACCRTTIRRPPDTMPSNADFGVLHLTAELWPFARTGGLGQAVADIAAQQKRTGIQSAVLMPLYRMAHEHIGEKKPLCDPFKVTMNGVAEAVRCWELCGTADGPRIFFLDHPASFDRAGIYGEDGADYPDNDRRFALFSLAALSVAARLESPRLVLHAHDWHAALAPVYLRTRPPGNPELERMPVVLTVHNGGFQGHYGRESLATIGLPEFLWSVDYMEWYGRLNYLKGGLKFADMVTTVSPTHAVEMRSEVGGFGLHDVFQKLGDRFTGIRNGIDTELWDPATDTEITGHFDADDLAASRARSPILRAPTAPAQSSRWSAWSTCRSSISRCSGGTRCTRADR